MRPRDPMETPPLVTTIALETELAWNLNELLFVTNSSES